MPHWPITRLIRAGVARPETPFATVANLRGLRRLAAVGPAAEAAGLRVGQALADARAICRELVLAESDPDADAAALARLAVWCERYTPLAAPDPPEGVWLDITGCAHLHAGGEAGLVADLAERLQQANIDARIAVAGSTGAAWALAHAPGNDSKFVLPPGEEPLALPKLPTGSLRLDAGTLAGLRRVGLRTIGEIARLPRADVSIRFGAGLLTRLDQAFGRAEEAIAWPRAAAPFLESINFADPIGTPEDLARALALLAARLCVRLEAAMLGGQNFVAQCVRVDGQASRIAVTTAQPSRDAAHLVELLTEKLETVDPGFGIETMSMAAESLAALSPAQAGFKEATSGSHLAAVVDTLANRLGEARVWRPAPVASHVPERAATRAPPLARAPSWETDPAQPRPIRLLRRPEPIEVTASLPDDPPVQFRWRRALHRVRAAAGPERIAAEWWRCGKPEDGSEMDLVRDYYRVEDSEGARFWVFRAGLHGGGRTPRWFLHGLFG